MSLIKTIEHNPDFEPIHSKPEVERLISGDPAFKSYRMAPELNSFSGKPRILLVPAKNPNGLPLAVIEASGEPARLNAFGPLMAEPLGTRIADDARRWATGHTGCSA